MLLPLLLNLGMAGGTVVTPPEPPIEIDELSGDGFGKADYNYAVNEKGELQNVQEEEDILSFIKVFLKWRS